LLHYRSRINLIPRIKSKRIRRSEIIIRRRSIESKIRFLHFPCFLCSPSLPNQPALHLYRSDPNQHPASSIQHPALLLFSALTIHIYMNRKDKKKRWMLVGTQPALYSVKGLIRYSRQTIHLYPNKRRSLLPLSLPPNPFFSRKERERQGVKRTQPEKGTRNQEPARFFCKSTSPLHSEGLVDWLGSLLYKGEGKGYKDEVRFIHYIRPFVRVKMKFASLEI